VWKGRSEDATPNDGCYADATNERGFLKKNIYSWRKRPLLLTRS